MKFRITYNVGELQFTAEADNLARAYDYVRSIITSNKTIFPGQEEMMAESMEVLALIKRGETIKYSNHVFMVEAVRDECPPGVTAPEPDAGQVSEPEAAGSLKPKAKFDEGYRAEEYAPAVVPKLEAPASASRPEGARGLLRLRCPECGSTFGTFLKERQRDIACKCGHRIDLTAPLARYRFTCPYCEKDTWGQTNLEDPEITLRCRCGMDVDVMWVPKAKEYSELNAVGRM